MVSRLVTVGGFDQQALFDGVFDRPMNDFLEETLKGGVLDSFGLGTAIRALDVEQQVQDPEPPITGMSDVRPRGGRGQFIQRTPGDPILSEEEYRQSPNFRPNIPHNPRMTERRAAALAAWDDARQVRQTRIAQANRPVAAFLGALAGQALDPINYIPFVGPAARGIATAKFGVVAGRAATASLDAVVNTAVFGALTAQQRNQLGDQFTVNDYLLELAGAAIIGAAFGTAGGTLEARQLRRSRAARQHVTETVEALNDAVESFHLEGRINVTDQTVNSVRRIAAEEVVFRDTFGDTRRFVNTRGRGETFHGSPAPIDRASELHYSGRNYYGQGLYDSDAFDVVDGYAKRNGADNGYYYRVTTKEPNVTFDMEQPIPDWLIPQEEEITSFKLDLLNDALSDNPQNVREFFDAIRDWSPHHGYSSDDVQEIFEDFQTRMKDQGFTAMSHKGGLRTGTQEHQVTIHFNPGNVNLEPVNPGDFRDPGTSLKLDNFAPEQFRVDPETAVQLRAAEARVGRIPKSLKEEAADLGIDPETGQFDELDDIALLDQQGRLTANEKTRLDRARQAVADTDAYARALDQAAACEIR